MVYSQVLRWCSGFTGLRHTNRGVHVLARCPALCWLRRHTFGEFFYDEDQDFTWYSKEMLNFLRNPTIQALENCDEEGLIIVFYEEFDK